MGTRPAAPGGGVSPRIAFDGPPARRAPIRALASLGDDTRPPGTTVHRAIKGTRSQGAWLIRVSRLTGEKSGRRHFDDVAWGAPCLGPAVTWLVLV
ncbi:MAG: hypothetical protein ACI9WU_004597 [Myxococcota bacterium]|jgi:hypothetical protein